MATSGPLADFARLPTQRKILVFVVIGFLLVGLYWQFFYKGLNRDIEAAEQDHQNKVGQNSRLISDIPAYEKLKTKFTELQKIVSENQKALPTQSELPAFFETLNRKVKDSGVEIKNWSQLPDEPVDVFVKVPVRIEINGTFIEIKRFFASLVQKRDDTSTTASPDAPKDRERVVSIESLALGDPKVLNHELILTAKFTAATFRQDELKVATPVASPGAAPPPPPAGSTAPPMPSAATPAGARVRVEDAMKKDQDRTDKGVEKATVSAPTTAPGAPAGSGVTRLKGGQ